MIALLQQKQHRGWSISFNNSYKTAYFNKTDRVLTL